MNPLFHLNMQQQIADNEIARQALAAALEKAKPKKGKPAYVYLQLIFKQGKATSQELKALRPTACRGDVYNRLVRFIKADKIIFTRLCPHSGLYEPADGVNAEDLGIEIGEKA